MLAYGSRCTHAFGRERIANEDARAHLRRASTDQDAAGVSSRRRLSTAAASNVGCPLACTTPTFSIWPSAKTVTSTFTLRAGSFNGSRRSRVQSDARYVCAKYRMQSHVGRVDEGDPRFYRLVRQPTLVPRNDGAGEWRGCITSSLFAHAPCRIRCLCAFADDRAARAAH